jgi:hypothetical protein
VKFLPFIWSQLTRNKLRTLLTAGAISLAIALVCLLLTMPAGMNFMLKQLASNTRLVVHNEAGLVYPLPYAYIQKVRSMPGVVGAVSWTWFGGAFEIEKGVAFPNFAVEPEGVGVVFEDYGILPEQLEAFRRNRDGAIVGRGTLASMKWKVGDLVTLQSTVWPVDLSFRIVGEIPNDRAPHFWFQREYLDQALRAAGRGGLEQLGTIWVRVDDPEQVAPLMARVHRLTKAVTKALNPDGVTVVQFNGAPAGQTIFHLHFHIIPRYEGKALAGQPVGEPVHWENPATSASGSITVVEEFEAGGRPCKRLRIENRANGQTGTGLWQYCREPDGRWELSSIR